MQEPSANVPVVVIGRNEGERLKVCLRSVLPQAPVTIYVDSGSTDGSAAFARMLGCRVIELDPSRPFGPSRARNEGFVAAMEVSPHAEFVQFLDGDCEMLPGWLQEGAAALRERPDAAIVCGTVHEMFPDASPYNKIYEIEWQNPVGEIEACAGRMMVRTSLFRESGGFRTDIIAGEDEEFCYRLRRSGWKVLQLEAPMARHDVAMLHLHQYWRRSRRTGFAYGQVADLVADHETIYSREILRLWVWGILLPLTAVVLAAFTHGFSLFLLLGYLVVVARIANTIRKRGWSARDARTYAWLTTASKIPGMQGLLEYYWWRLRGGQAAVSDQYYDYKINSPQAKNAGAESSRLR